MRKAMMMGALVTLLVALFAAAAFAATVNCGDTLPCVGTNNADTINERAGAGLRDDIFAKRGPDTVDADNFCNDRDDLRGNRGNDNIQADDGDGLDWIDGGPGRDTCVSDAGDVEVRCELN